MGIGALDQLGGRLRHGRPLLLGSDLGACLRVRGVAVGGAGTIGRLLRDQPEAIDEHYAFELDAGVDVLTALTADTTPRALAQVGMAYRSAAITAKALDRALDAADSVARPILVAATIGGGDVAPTDITGMADEHGEHASRLAAAGTAVVVARGAATRLELLTAATAGVSAGIPTWTVVPVAANGLAWGTDDAVEVARHLDELGVDATLFEVATARLGIAVLGRARDAEVTQPLGALIAASEAAVAGYPDEASSPEQWADEAVSLLAADPRILGGGSGTLDRHIAALATRLRIAVPTMAPPSMRQVS